MLTGFITLYLLFIMTVGLWASRRIKTIDDFTLAGRSLSAIFVGITIFATWFGSEFIMGEPGNFIQNGLTGIISNQIGSFICLLLVGFFYAKKMHQLKVTTINDFFRIRYSSTIEMITSLINIFTFFSWIAAQFVALGLLFNIILGVPVAWGIAIGAFIVVIYTYIGGMWAVTITNLFQAILIFLGLLLVLMQLLGETNGLLAVVASTPKDFFKILPEPGFVNWINYLSLWLVFGIGAIPAQELYQCIFSARSKKAAKQGVFIASVILFTVGAIPLLIALCINYIYPEIIQRNDAQNIIPAMVFKYTSLPIQVMFFGALISAILSTSSAAMLAPATVIGENLIKPHIKNITDKQLLLFTRLCVLLIAIISTTMAFFNSSIHELVINSIILYLVCLIAPFTLGLYWKKASVNGAWSAIIAGGIVWLLCVGINTEIEPWVYGFIVNIIVMVIISSLTPDKSFTQFEQSKLRYDV